MFLLGVTSAPSAPGVAAGRKSGTRDAHHLPKSRRYRLAAARYEVVSLTKCAILHVLRLRSRVLIRE